MEQNNFVIEKNAERTELSSRKDKQFIKKYIVSFIKKLVPYTLLCRYRFIYVV